MKLSCRVEMGTVSGSHGTLGVTQGLGPEIHLPEVVVGVVDMERVWQMLQTKEKARTRRHGMK